MREFDQYNPIDRDKLISCSIFNVNYRKYHMQQTPFLQNKTLFQFSSFRAIARKYSDIGLSFMKFNLITKLRIK